LISVTHPDIVGIVFIKKIFCQNTV